jgi:FkbM family methyltransferase
MALNHLFAAATIEERMRKANLAADEAKRALAECYEFYMSIEQSNREMDIYSRGWLRARIWEIEQVFGHKSVFLSAAGQDQFIYETYFKDKRDGVYVEIGGYDGCRGSNCYFFEKTLNWKGAIVEASPTQVKNIGKYRNAEIVHAAISDKNGLSDFIDVISGATQMSGLAQHYVGSKLSQVRNYPGHSEQKVRVAMMTLGDLLDSLNFKHIDYCSIDVEGAERVILENFDFQSYDISVFSIESAVGNETSSLKDILLPAGYSLTAVIGDDEIYVRNDF